MMFSRMAYTLLAGLVLIASAVPAEAAEIDLSLNLAFNDTNDLNSGGTWTIVGKADEQGIAGLSIYVDGTQMSFDLNSGYVIPDTVFEVQRSNLEFNPNVARIEFVLGDDLSDITLDVGVVGGSYPSTYVDAPDILLVGSNPDLGSFSGGVELLTGTFAPGQLPDWDTGHGGNVFIGTQAIGATVNTTVRITGVPEPASILLLACFVVPVGLLRHR